MSKALIVEDSLTTRGIVQHMLAALGYDCLEAKNGVEGLKLAKEHITELAFIISDIQMPQMNGFEFVHSLTGEPWYDHTPIVITSTMSDAHNIIRILKMGATDFIPKPFQTEQVATVISRILYNGTAN